MVKETDKEGKSVYLDDKSLKWVDKQVNEGTFDSRSSGIRRCIQIARRIYENGNPNELTKFVIGKKIKNGKG